MAGACFCSWLREHTIGESSPVGSTTWAAAEISSGLVHGGDTWQTRSSQSRGKQRDAGKVGPTDMEADRWKFATKFNARTGFSQPTIDALFPRIGDDLLQ